MAEDDVPASRPDVPVAGSLANSTQNDESGKGEMRLDLEGVYTSESVTEGHPDKIADYISDSVLDAVLERDPMGRVACEVMCKADAIILAGEIGPLDPRSFDWSAIVRKALRDISNDEHAAAAAQIQYDLLSQQAEQIAQGVSSAYDAPGETGAGDQGLMYGYATDETPELMPLPALLAHRLSRALAEHRKNGRARFLRPDGKTQVAVRYEDGRPTSVERVLVSTQHAVDAAVEYVREYVATVIAREALGPWYSPELVIAVNPAGTWTHGGASADAGVTGRKIIVDTYGGMARHGGGAFSGKDPTKVDRSAAYFCRFVARQVIEQGIARRAEVRVAYTIGIAQPFAMGVDVFGTGDQQAAEMFLKQFDFRPGAMIERLDLRHPFYRTTTNYGHFGRPGLPWEI